MGLADHWYQKSSKGYGMLLILELIDWLVAVIIRAFKLLVR